jgi:hypothetical protein
VTALGSCLAAYGPSNLSRRGSSKRHAWAHRPAKSTWLALIGDSCPPLMIS